MFCIFTLAAFYCKYGIIVSNPGFLPKQNKSKEKINSDNEEDKQITDTCTKCLVNRSDFTLLDDVDTKGNTITFN